MRCSLSWCWRGSSSRSARLTALRVLEEAGLAGPSYAGVKGYITNLVACPDGTPVTAEFVIGAYHQLFQIERLYHHLRDSIEAT
jgi:hypothetical protein